MPQGSALSDAPPQMRRKTGLVGAPVIPNSGSASKCSNTVSKT